jgi:hypothetical protein
MVKGRLDKKASTATGYGWLVWEKKKSKASSPRLIWIPPCRKTLERPGDYDMPIRRLAAKPTLQPKRRAEPDLFGGCDGIHGVGPADLG